MRHVTNKFMYLETNSYSRKKTEISINSKRAILYLLSFNKSLYFFAQFKKIVALSNLIQRIYHNDIRNMLP